MKIISWNVNGLRASVKKGVFQELFTKESPDILIIQETKSTIDQITADILNYNNYYSCFESSKVRKGYSGVAIYSRDKPKKVDYGLGVKGFVDDEGRTIIAHYDDYVVMNCYWPNGGRDNEHFLYKLEYYKHFLNLAKKLEKIKPVIFGGDINATVADIDLARPKENAGTLGCTPEERAQLAIYCQEFVDTYRYVNGDKIEYSWWDMKTKSRERNVGWRIDYFFVSKILKKKIVDAKILTDFMGSDHAPVVLVLK